MSSTLHQLPDLDAALHHLRGLVASAGTAILVDNVDAWPTPPGWVYRLGAVRKLPADLQRHGWQQAWWLLKFRTSTAWLDHLASDRYLSRQVFGQCYGAIFPGAPVPHPRLRPRPGLAQPGIATKRFHSTLLDLEPDRRWPWLRMEI